MKHIDIFSNELSAAIPIYLVSRADLSAYLKTLDEKTQNILVNTQFQALPHTYCLITTEQGHLEKVIVGYEKADIWAIASLPLLLPEAIYTVDAANTEFDNVLLELGWALGAYQFTKYKLAKRVPAKIVIRNNQDVSLLHDLCDAIYLIRDLINTPAEEMNPAALAAQTENLAMQYGAELNTIVGDELLTQNFPTIYRVGRAATEADNQPRLIELNWGDPKHKKLTLVGKGVCFDTGGLDIKSSSGMLLMKKDMGGAAHCLGLAKLIMAQQLPIKLRVLIPAVENAISDNAMRPSDVIKTRKGLTVEIGNTDAEGRLILSDALTYACEQDYALLLDFATLTGAHHVALGPDIPALLTKNATLAHDLQAIAENCDDLLWPLPLYQPYRAYLDSMVADINNTSRLPYAGCITAGLFLAEFVNDTQKWAHFDLMAYNPETLPGRAVGGSAQGLRAVFYYLKKVFKR